MLSSFFFRQPRLLLILIGSICFAGISAYYLLPKIEDPIIRKRVGVVTTLFSGASADEMEILVARPLEDALEKINEVLTIKSNCRAGILTVVIELADHVTQVDQAWNKVQMAIDFPDQELPKECGTPKLHVFPLKAYASIISFQSDTATESTVMPAALGVEEKLQQVRGTEKVMLFGGTEAEIQVRAAPDSLNQHGISFGRFANETSKLLTNGAIGEIELGDFRTRIGLSPPDDPLEKIREHTLVDAFGKKVAVEDLAEVELESVSQRDSRARVNGKPAVVLAVMVEDACHLDQWSAELEQLLAETRQHYPDLQIQELFSQQTQIRQRMQRLFRNLMFSAIAVVFVVLLLMGWKSMVIIAAALPLTVFLVLAGMRLLGIPIHQISVTGIIVSLGLLIDNAIVVVDDVRKKIYGGVHPVSAIQHSIRHLRLPLLGATLTTAFSFLPIAMLPGPAGEFVGSIALTVILAVVASYLVATIILPSLIGRTIHSHEQTLLLEYGIQYRPISDHYFKYLKASCEKPWVAVLVGSIVSTLGFLIWKDLPVQFFPATDRQQIQIEVEKSNFTSINGLEQSVTKIESILATRQELSGQYWFLGGSAPTFYYNVVPRYIRAPHYAQAFLDLNLQDSDQHPAKRVEELQELVDEQTPDARVTIRRLEQGPPFDAPIEVILVGPDQDELIEVGQQIRRVLINTEGVIQTRSDLNAIRISYDFNPNEKAAAEVSVTDAEIQRELRAAVHGLHAGSTIIDGERIPVRVELDLDAQAAIPQGLLDLPIAGQDPRRSGSPGTLRQPSVAGTAPRNALAPNTVGPNSMGQNSAVEVPTLGMIGQFELQTTRPQILRRNGENVNIIKGYIRASELSSAVLKRFQENLAKSQLVLPPGFRIEFGGEEQKRTRAESSLFANAPLFVFLILFLMVAIFGSFRAAFSIAVIGLLTMGLVPLALFLFSYPFGFMAVIGAMGLVGVAINDSIVVLAGLFSLDKQARTDPHSVAEVVFDNTRHILATTCTTVAGFLPLLISGGEFWPPMAIAMCAGIMGATLLAVFFLPALFLILNSLTPIGEESSSERSLERDP